MMRDKLKLIADSFGDSKVKWDEPLLQYAALKQGGCAALFFIAFTTREIIKVVEMARDLKVPLFIFGTGSKMIISDKGFEGIVVKNRTSGVSVVGVKGKVSKNGIGVDEALIEVESGLSINKLVEFLKKQGLSSDEIIGLPGSIGGNLSLNKVLQERTLSLKVIEGGEVEEIKIDQLNLRSQIILSAIFKFKSKVV